MKISCIVPARDEGVQVVPTLSSLKEAGADEIILIDDGSEKDRACHSSEAKELADTVIHYKTARGPAYCRNAGATAATGDILVFCDCHVRCKPGSLRQFGMTANDNRGWANASIQPMFPSKNKMCTKYGGVFRDNKAGYDILYRKNPPEQPVAAVTGLIGAFYAIPRDVFFDQLGGWPMTISHGYNEQGISMASFLAGVPMVVDREMVIQHMFKSSYNYSTVGLHPHLNRFLVHFVLFSDTTWKEYWFPRLKQYMSFEKDTKPAMELLKQPEWVARRDRFQKLKRKTDQEFFQMVKDQGPLELLVTEEDLKRR